MPTASIRGFELYHEVYGSGEPLICTTGWGTGTGHRVAGYPDALPQEFQMVVYDHRGIGRSRGGLDREPSTELYADDVAALMDHLGIERARIFGRGGLGGCIAQQVAIRHPQRVVSAIFGQAWARADAFLADQFDTLAALRRQGFADFQRACSWLCHHPEYFNAHTDELLGERGAWSDIAAAEDGHLALIAASAAHDVEATLGRVECPVLVVQGGRRDGITGERLGHQQKRLLAHAELEVLADAPHAVKTHPPSWERYVELVMGFLRRPDAR